jgi:hypothetical protein
MLVTTLTDYMTHMYYQNYCAEYYKQKESNADAKIDETVMRT